MKKTVLLVCMYISLQASSDRMYQAGLGATIIGNIATFMALKSKNAPVLFPSLLRFGKSRAALAATYAANYPLWFASVLYTGVIAPESYRDESHPSRYFFNGVAAASSEICVLPFILPYAVKQKASSDAHYMWSK